MPTPEKNSPALTESDMQMAGKVMADPPQIEAGAPFVCLDEHALASIISQHLASERERMVELERKAKALDWLNDQEGLTTCGFVFSWFRAAENNELLTAIEAAMRKELNG